MERETLVEIAKALKAKMLEEKAFDQKMEKAFDEFIGNDIKIESDESLKPCIGNCVLVQTIGNSPPQYLRTIEYFNPQQLIHISTEKTSKYSEIIKKMIKKDMTIYTLKKNGNDIFEILKVCNENIFELMQNQERNQYFVFDLTGGKKTMSSGTVALIIQSKNIAEDKIKLCYLEYNEEQKKQVLWDLSKVIYLNANYDFDIHKKQIFGKTYAFQDEMKKLSDAYSWLVRNGFDKYAEYCEELKKIKYKKEILGIYKCFDSEFKFNANDERLSDYKKFDKQVAVNINAFKNVVNGLNLMEKKEGDLVSVKMYVPYLVINIYLRSYRYYTLGRYIEAAIYAYRALELFFDYMLGFEFGTLDYLNEDKTYRMDLLERIGLMKIEEFYKKLNPHKDQKRGISNESDEDISKIKSGLVSKARILFAILLTKSTKITYEKAKKYLETIDSVIEARNMSIIVHGFKKPSRREVENLHEVFWELINNFEVNPEEKLKELLYPFEEAPKRREVDAGRGEMEKEENNCEIDTGTHSNVN